ncbi:sigma factor-like helix-turn-helix DNA-binding protein [Vibrio sinaloensis]|uniref:sigma factor-like helix-turn-helix DNA-binding protein n=1 Tax=Photobacterium sp. (strain ATCC 43367) TaxID=379097 RepID=UPI002F3FA228
MSNVDTQNFSKSDWASCMERVKQQDKQAFALVFKHFSPRLKQFTYRHVGNEQVAMEMVQETLATVWQKSALEDLPHQQVADMLDIPLGTVKSRLRLAVEKLRISIEADKL